MFFELFQNFGRSGTIIVAARAPGVAEYPGLVDQEGGRAVAYFSVDSHLKRHAVGGADDLSRIDQERVIHIFAREPNLL